MRCVFFYHQPLDADQRGFLDRTWPAYNFLTLQVYWKSFKNNKLDWLYHESYAFNQKTAFLDKAGKSQVKRRQLPKPRFKVRAVYTPRLKESRGASNKSC